MILITGGLGFVGTHTTRALLDRGESCVLVQRRTTTLPKGLTGNAVVEQVDITDRAAFLDIGGRHPVTGIVHLAGVFDGTDPIEDIRRETDSLLTVLEAARDWGVARVTLASTIGVYGGAPGTSPFREDVPLPLAAGPLIPAVKKIDELIADLVGGALGVEVIRCRIGAVWGPGGRPSSRFLAAPELVHAAVDGTAIRSPHHADDGIDMCYAPDCGTAIALLHTAGGLRHTVYNVASGRPTTNGEVAAAIRRVVPGADIQLAQGSSTSSTWLDITRLREDTGFTPAYDNDTAVADYVAWLRAGNER
ncbi:MAG TPA: NAD(P)-dependent oxidoreductase [Pseudonocardiaceae bacterium]|jgi:UDP-glucose 4-epimerase|nr:NAD(P)-dependent oxidoreductase [Pseudonocardiaceae bacterium]